MKGILLALALVLFVAVVGVWSFAITDGLGPIGPGGVGAVIAFGVGAALLIGVFLLILRHRGRSGLDGP